MMTITATALSTRRHDAPALPAGFGELDTVSLAGQYAMIADRLNTLRNAYTRTTKWLEACALYSLAAADAPSVRAMPSKDHKHRMYGTAADLTRACGWDSAATRCHNLDDLAVLIATVESLLRGH